MRIAERTNTAPTTTISGVAREVDVIIKYCKKARARVCVDLPVSTVRFSSSICSDHAQTIYVNDPSIRQINEKKKRSHFGNNITTECAEYCPILSCENVVRFDRFELIVFHFQDFIINHIQQHLFISGVLYVLVN